VFENVKRGRFESFLERQLYWAETGDINKIVAGLGGVEGTCNNFTLEL
jgi:hypothetical protein